VGPGNEATSYKAPCQQACITQKRSIQICTELESPPRHRLARKPCRYNPPSRVRLRFAGDVVLAWLRVVPTGPSEAEWVASPRKAITPRPAYSKSHLCGFKESQQLFRHPT
jgi:hypothetical protein